MKLNLSPQFLHSSFHDSAIIIVKVRQSMVDLKKCLQRTGKSCFVKYFEEFKKGLSNIAYQEIITENYTKIAKDTRSSNAKAIFRENLEIEALQNIVLSKKLAPELRQEALKLLYKYKH